MKITQIETIPIRLPTRRVHQWASLTTPIGVYVIIKLHTDEGLIGFGEAPVLKDWGGDHGKYFGETPQITIHIINDILAPALTGQDPWFDRWRPERYCLESGFLLTRANL